MSVVVHDRVLVYECPDRVQWLFGDNCPESAWNGDCALAHINVDKGRSVTHAQGVVQQDATQGGFARISGSTDHHLVQHTIGYREAQGSELGFTKKTCLSLFALAIDPL